MEIKVAIKNLDDLQKISEVAKKDDEDIDLCGYTCGKTCGVTITDKPVKGGD